VIVSRRHRDQDYQLNTTIDRGPRTIGLKLSDAARRSSISGSLGRMQIYSFALTKPQITADMRGKVISAPPF